MPTEPTSRVVELPSGRSYTFRPLKAFDVIEVERILGRPMHAVDQADAKWAIVVAWRFAVAGGYTGTWEDFAKEVDWTDVPVLMEEIQAFFGAAGPSTEADSSASSAQA